MVNSTPSHADVNNCCTSKRDFQVLKPFCLPVHAAKLLHDGHLDTTDLRVLHIITAFSATDCGCYYTSAKMGEMLGKGTRQIQRAIKNLSGLGLIHIQESSRARNAFRRIWASWMYSTDGRTRNVVPECGAGEDIPCPQASPDDATEVGIGSPGVMGRRQASSGDATEVGIGPQSGADQDFYTPVHHFGGETGVKSPATDTSISDIIPTSVASPDDAHNKRQENTEKKTEERTPLPPADAGCTGVLGERSLQKPKNQNSDPFFDPALTNEQRREMLRQEAVAFREQAARWLAEKPERERREREEREREEEARRQERLKRLDREEEERRARWAAQDRRNAEKPPRDPRVPTPERLAERAQEQARRDAWLTEEPVPTFDAPPVAEQEPPAQDRDSVKWLHDILRKNNRLEGIKFSAPAWAKALAGLEKQVGRGRVHQILAWLETAIKDKFTPRVYSAKTFVDKWASLVDAFKRTQKPSDQKPTRVPNKTAKSILDVILAWYWPDDADELLPDVVMDSLVGMIAFKNALRRVIKDERHHTLHPFAEKLLRECGPNDEAIIRWVQWQHARYSEWDGWAGRIAPMVMGEGMFRKWGRKQSMEFTLDRKEWDALTEVIRAD